MWDQHQLSQPVESGGGRKVPDGIWQRERGNGWKLLIDDERRWSHETTMRGGLLIIEGTYS